MISEQGVNISIGAPSIKISIGQNKVTVNTGTQVARDGSSIPEYDGDYIVTPLAYRQTILETFGKRMADDVTVKEVPFYEVSNTKGKTVYIADTIND